MAVVPHTHWDREWYEPFQASRLRLVDLLDELLLRLETDPSFTHFQLDGQMAVVDDYLAVRPEAEDRLRRLVGSGRVAVGPWYVLPDEFLVSGETLVRNLQLGFDRATAFGGAMEVGYLPDMFGHVAQMPQLLRLAGLEHAVVWRGVPSAVDRTAFNWSAPDGSTVRAEYLPVGYANGADVPDDAKRLLDRVRAHETELGGLLHPHAPMLWMNGGDHRPPQTFLGRVVAEVNGLTDDYRLTVTPLAAYLALADAAVPAAGLPRWTGELRSGARANLLMGVASNRVDVKQAAARAERALERLAEPLCALFLDRSAWPAALLHTAWTEMARNAAHDSVCACSADEVVDAVLVRYAEARQVGEGLAAQSLARLATSLSVTGPVVVNPSARIRSGLVELVLAGDEPVDGVQILFARPGATSDRTMAGSDVGPLVGRLRTSEQALGGDVVGVDLADDESGLSVVLRTGARTGRIHDGTGAALADLYARAGARRHLPVHVRVEHQPYRRALVRADDVPAFGWAAWSAATVAGPPVHAAGRALANGLVRVEVDPDDGTFSLDGVSGLDLLVDDGDAGDTYNYSPPDLDAVVDAPATVTVEVDEEGPLRAALRVTRAYDWPERLVDGARTGERRVDVVTRLELRTGERLVRVTTTVDNRCRDHRLRSWFALPQRAVSSVAECAFGVVERGIEAEGGPSERGLPTFPSRRFVSAGGLTVFHEGLLEYELVDDRRALALTLLRCVGVLSGTDLTYRPQPAGPPVPVEGAQMPGRHVLRYAVALNVDDPYASADDAFVPLQVTTGSGLGLRPPTGSLLTVSGAEVSAVRRTDAGALEVRVFNPTPSTATVDLGDRSGWLVDLRGRALSPFAGQFVLHPWGIATVQLA
ncbi:MAG: alpha-mannosidase [Actinomycetota bacterium]|nr:alpha-mannosidase [Actinomycetota bacterium]